MSDEKKKYTSDEFLAMTDLQGRYELVSGELYNMVPAPGIAHQLLSKKLLKRIDDHIEENDGECIVLDAPTDVKLNDETIVQPDIFVVCDPKKLDDKKCNGAPDWVIEILSPSNANHDTIKKYELYLNAGVREYWIIDPEYERVFVHSFENGTAAQIFTFDDDIPAGIYKNEAKPLIIRINGLYKKRGNNEKEKSKMSISERFSNVGHKLGEAAGELAGAADEAIDAVKKKYNESVTPEKREEIKNTFDKGAKKLDEVVTAAADTIEKGVKDIADGFKSANSSDKK